MASLRTWSRSFAVVSKCVNVLAMAAPLSPSEPRVKGSAGAAGVVPYARLLLPMWGDGRVSLLLGAFAWH